jgi:hemerythrin-like domain-containing protein
MKAIEILVNEHVSILKMIEITKTMLNNTDTTSEINIEHVEKVIDFIKNFADKYHHLKEEDILFMEMERHGMPRENGPIGVMLIEHDQGRAYIKQAIEAIDKFKLGDISSLPQIRKNLLNYCSLLTDHIYKEDHILYPMAENFIPENILKTMAEDFEESNTTTMNNEYFDKYLKLVDEFSLIYLK